MSGKKGMKGGGGARPGAGRPPARHIIRLGARYAIQERAEIAGLTQAGDYIFTFRAWTVTAADSEGITLTNAAGDSITIRKDAST